MLTIIATLLLTIVGLVVIGFLVAIVAALVGTFSVVGDVIVFLLSGGAIVILGVVLGWHLVSKIVKKRK